MVDEHLTQCEACRKLLVQMDGELVSPVAKDADIKAALTAPIEALFFDEKIVIGENAVISNARQNAALTRTLDFISTAKQALMLGMPEDAACSDVERALGAIGELDGKEISEQIVADIFKKFCVGK